MANLLTPASAETRTDYNQVWKSMRELQQNMRQCQRQFSKPSAIELFQFRIHRLSNAFVPIQKQLQKESAPDELRTRFHLLGDDLEGLRSRVRIIAAKTAPLPDEEVTLALPKADLQNLGGNSQLPAVLTIKGKRSKMTPANIEDFLKAYFPFHWCRDRALNSVQNKGYEEEARSSALEALGDAETAFKIVGKRTGISISN